MSPPSWTSLPPPTPLSCHRTLSLSSLHLLFFNYFFHIDCMSCLCSLDINPLLGISFTNIFSHSAGYFFILLLVSFVVQKSLNLNQFHLFISAFVSSAWGDRAFKILLWFMSESVLPQPSFLKWFFPLIAPSCQYISEFF